MEHIEEAGIHSGDSACSLPPYSLSSEILEIIKSETKALAQELNVIGLMNIQFAVKDDKVYILEVNPRASRTIPYVSKSIGVPLAKLAAKVMAGKSLDQLETSLQKVRDEVKLMVKNKAACTVPTDMTLNDSKAQARKFFNREVKLRLRCIDNAGKAAISLVDWNNVIRLKERIGDVFHEVNKSGPILNVSVSKSSSRVPKPPGKATRARARIKNCILRMAK